MQKLETSILNDANASIANAKSETDMLSVIRKYQQVTFTTAVYPEAGEYSEREVNYLILGLVGEAGELANKFKKMLRSGVVTLDHPKAKLVLKSEELSILTDEMGDILWYLARLADVLHVNLEVLAQLNYTKLLERKHAGQLKDHK